MIRMRNAALAVVAGLLATGALAQSFTQGAQSVNVPEELFGGDAVKLEFNGYGDEDGFVPTAELTFGGSATIAAGTEFEVTYTLANATFAERASVNDFMWGSLGPANDTRGGLDCTGVAGEETLAANADQDLTATTFCTMYSPNDSARSADNTTNHGTEVTVTVEDGGARGDGSVTYKVKVGNADIPSLATPMLADHDNDATTPMQIVGSTRKIVWAVPDVNASGLIKAYGAAYPPLWFGRDVTVSTMIERATSTGTAISEKLSGATNKCGDVVSTDVNAVVSCPLVNAVQMVDVTAANGDGGNISLAPADGRAVLVKSNGSPVDPQRAHIAEVVVSADQFGSGVRDEEGGAITSFKGALAGSLAITVSSEGLREGDMVYIDANGNKKVDGREAFEIDGATASDTVPLALDEGKTTMTRHVYYVPNGKDAMKHRTGFTTHAATEFSDTNHKERSTWDVPGEKPATAQLGLVGIKPDTAKAYAIAPLGSSDTANVRVTCESGAPAGCNVFLDCKDPMGMNTFGEAGANVGPGMTVRWNQMQIAEALGLADGWEGRMACEVLSSAEITVQVLTRAAGVLVNNTATDSGGT